MSVWKGLANFVKGFFGKLGEGNYSEFENDGTLLFRGDATTWDDLRSPFTLVRRGALNKPDFDYTNLGLLFPQDDASEKIYLIMQLPHSLKLGSNIYPHIHWIQSQADFPIWKLDYRWYNQGNSPPSFTTLSTNTGIVEYPGSGSISQYSAFAAIDGSGITALSSIFEAIIYRDDDVVSGDVLGKEFDFHYEKDSTGSRQELTK